MRFRALGPLEVCDSQGRPVELTGAKPRALLSLLLAEPGRVLSMDRIVERLWSQEPPPSAVATVQSYIAQLRRLLEPERGPRAASTVVLTRGNGYLLSADETALDLLRFPALVAHGRELLDGGDPSAAERLLLEALSLWRGEPLQDLPDSPETDTERGRLRQVWLLAREQLAAARTRSGRPELAVPDLELLVAENPLDERLWARLVESLYAAGRQADALAALRRCGGMLRQELGIDPGPDLVALEQAILRQDPVLGRAPTPGVSSESAASPPGSGHTATDAGPPADDFVGRDRERDRIRAVLGQVTRGSGSVLVLEGEAGIGKTRLADVAATMAGAQGWRVAWSRCADDAGVPALWPWTQLLEQLELPALSARPGDDPDSSRFALFQELRDRLRELTSRSPVLVVLDDVQAADDSSLQLLTLLAQHLTGLRLLIVATARTVGEQLADPVVACLAALARESRVQRLQLGGLAEDDVRRLLSTRLGVEGRDGLAAEVHLRTDGNPFFVVELVSLLLSEERLEGDAGESLPRSLPPSVRDVLQRRLERLPEDTVRLLQLAAVAGRDVDLVLLEAAAGMDPEQVISLLEPAVAAGVVSEDQATWQWRFSHALVQETLIAGLTRLERARLHAQVAEALRSRGSGSGEEVERLAHHYFHAVPVTGPGPAIDYLRAAASAARARLAHPEAAEHTRRALQLIPPGDTARERHDLLVALGDDLLRNGVPQQAHEAVAEALEAARKVGDRERMAEAASVWGGLTLWNWRGYGVVDYSLVSLLEDLAAEAREHDPALRARLLGTLGVELAYSPRRDEGVAYAAAAVELARSLGDPALLGLTLNNYGIAAWGSHGTLPQRLAAADESLALVGRGLPARTEFFARLHRGPMRLQLGDVVGFEADLAAAERIARSLSGPEVRPHLLYEETGRAMLHGQWEEAEALGTEANDLYRSTSMWGAAASWALHQFTFRRQEGRLGDVVDLLVDTGDLQIPLIQTIAVLAAAEAGDPPEARRLRRRWPDAWPEDWTTDALAVARAWVRLALGEDPRPSYAELVGQCGRQVVVGSATASWGSYDLVLGQLAIAMDDQGAAASHLQDAVEQGRAVGSPWQVRRAEGLIADLFASPTA